jgi:phosphatidylglycerophosphatase C
MATAVAAFDVDGTLTRRDSFFPFLHRVAGAGGLASALARRPVALARVAARRGDRDAEKAAVVRALLAGRTRAELEALGRRHAARMLRGTRPETVARLQWHRRAGHTVVLVSASLRCYLEPFAASLGAHALLCTDLVYDDDGVCTGQLLGANCRGPAKADRLREWAGGPVDELWAYGNSSCDAELLALAAHAFRVDRVRLVAVPDLSVA